MGAHARHRPGTRGSIVWSTRSCSPSSSSPRLTAASVLLREDDGTLHPRAARRREMARRAPIQVSSTILNHVIKERAGVLTHDASMDFASSKGKSMILNRISSAMVVPPPAREREGSSRGLVALTASRSRSSSRRTSGGSLLRSRAAGRDVHRQNTILAKKVEQRDCLRMIGLHGSSRRYHRCAHDERQARGQERRAAGSGALRLQQRYPRLYADERGHGRGKLIVEMLNGSTSS